MSNNSANQNNEITIQRFLFELWREKVIIAVITVIVFLAAVLFTYFTSETVYESKALIAISPVSEIETKYGIYRIPLNAVDEYANFACDPSTAALTIKSMGLEMAEDQLLDSISINATRGVSYFSMTVESDTAEGARNIAEKHLDSFSHTIEMLLRNMAVNFYINRLNGQSPLLADTLEQTEMNIYAVEEYLDDMPDPVPGQEIDPQYSKLSEELALLRMAQTSTRIRLNKIETDLKDLINEKELLDESRSNTEFESSIPGAFDQFSGIITVVNQPDLGEGRQTGKILFSALTGLVFGFMLGVFAARVKTSMRKSKK